MMMIAFITTKSGSSLLIEGLCAQIILYFVFEIIGGLCSHLLLFFVDRKICQRKKTASPHILPPSIHIQMFTLYTYTNTHMPRFNSSGFFRPSRCLISTPGRLTSEYPICAACECVSLYTYPHPHTLPPALKIEKTQTTPLSLLLSKVTPHATQ